MSKHKAIQLSGERNRWSFSFISVLFCIVSALILVLVLFFTNEDYLHKFFYSKYNFPIFLYVVICAAIVFFIIKKREKRIGKTHHITFSDVQITRFVRIFSVFFLIVQGFIAYNIYFLTDWDVQGILTIAQELVSDEPLTYAYYLSTYPNNLLLTFWQYLLLTINNWLHLFANGYESFIFVLFNCFTLNLSCYLVYRVLCKLTNCYYALIGYIVSVLLIGLSPWVVIPYSDQLGIFIPILVLYVFLWEEKTVKAFVFKWLIIAFLSVIGFYVKPTCLIVYIAIVVLCLLNNFNKKGIIRFICIISVTTMLFGGVSIGLTKLAKKHDIVLDPEQKMGWSHFLMMGLNTDSNGCYSHNDVAFSFSIPSASERTEKNLQVVKERLEEMGIIGLIQHLSKKMLTVFNDGTFAWGCEGVFYDQLFDEPNKTFAPWLRSIYYTTGSRYAVFGIISQSLWLAVILFMFAGSIKIIRKKKYCMTTSVMQFSILGLILYEMLFEVRARYLFIYVPFFIILAVIGIKDIYEDPKKF